MSKADFLVVIVLCAPTVAQAQVDRLNDRGSGQPTSMFGTYVKDGELLLYPFFEYYYDNDLEYKPEELGYGLDQDFRGKYRASEYLIFAAYGFNDWLAAEIEASYHIKAKLETAPDDPSGIPSVIEESGTGDVEGQLHVRLAHETESRPEFFGYFEAVSPQQKDKVLIGTPDWEFALGAGAVRGFGFGTMTVRLAAGYSKEDDTFDLGEYAVEYLKRLSPAWRVYAGLEGEQDEVEFIPEVQWHIRTDKVFLRVNSAIGVTSKATDWAPEVGVVISL